ncbi:hypothetical protein ACJDU8_04080 [Clostridium sp. WILCCON 0269]|uniref:DUF2029 domain-containing protein n=1 Tax=Candidatus Clostridium eludens TaxID=3381663 RepID=A0ABW8SHQ3_9CLOT
MIKVFFKKNVFKIILILLILLSALLCIYSIKNYKTSTSTTQNRLEQFNSNNGERSQRNNGQRTWGNTNSNKNTPNGNFRNFSKNNGKTPGTNTQMPSGNQQRGFMSSNNKYAPLLTLYLIIFFILSITAIYFFNRKNFRINNDNAKLLILALLCIGLFLRVSLSTVIEGYGGDISLFRSWASTAANGLSQFYANARSADYPPLYIYVLFLIGKIAKISSITPYYTLLLKFPSIIADIATSYIIYKLAKKYFSLEMGIFLSVFYIFNPCIFIDSALWGQVDSFFTLFVVLSLFLLSEGKIVLSSIFFTSTVLMKPQGIIFLPVLLFELVREKNLKTILKCIVSCVVTALVIILPFSFNQSGLWIFKLYASTISEYPYASVNGFNLFNLLGGNYKDISNTLFIFSYKIWGIIAIIAITVFSWYIYIKGKNRIFIFSCALVQIAGVFTFSTGMHERYLLPAAVLSILSFIYLKDKRLLTILAGYTITIYTNIYSVLFGSLRGMNSNSHSLITDGTSILNIILFIYLIKILVDIAIKKKGFNPESFDIKFY